MIKLKQILIIAALLACTKADMCQENFTLSEMPEGILAQAFSLLTTGTIIGFLGCLHEVEVPKSDVNFWYSSRDNSGAPILLNQTDPQEIDPDKDTIILIHGWLCNVSQDLMPELTKAYLDRFDVNVIGIDWSSRSVDLYTASFCAIPKIAEIIGEFVCSTPAIDVSRLHVLGHSMGGQISGLTGQEVKKQCNKKVKRITGLDPAGPLYQTQLHWNRLDKSDADFVDVIHSNMGFLGYYGTCGTADFYPNCGIFQNGCLRVSNVTSISEIINLPVGIVFCNHFRAVEYFIESISSNNFKAKSCAACALVPEVCVNDFPFGSESKMGEDCPATSKGKYNLKTNKESPFAKG